MRVLRAAFKGGYHINFVHINAQTAWFEPNNLHKQKLESIQEEARQRKVGIWGLPKSEQCQLANRGNGIGEGASGCPGG